MRDIDPTTIDKDTKFLLAANIKTKRPGCVIIQAAMGGSSALVSSLFDPRTWETDSRDMVVYSITLDQAKEFARRCNAEVGA